MAKLNRLYFTISMVSLVGLLSGCIWAETPTPIAQLTQLHSGVEVTVIKEIETVTNELSQTKTFNQCESASPFKSEIRFSQISEQETQNQLVLGGEGGGEIGLSQVAKMTITGKVEQYFLNTQRNEKGHEESIQIEVPPNTHQEYIINWNEKWRTGTVEYIEDGIKKTIEYSYRIGVELESSIVRDLMCPTQKASVPSVKVSPETGQSNDTQTTEYSSVEAELFRLPFSDDFDKGLKPEWKILGGNPVITNGLLKSAKDDLIIQIGDESNGNYSISLDWMCNWGLTIVFGNRIRFYYGGNVWYWQAYDNNQWTTITDIDPWRICVSSDSMETMVVSVMGNQYQIFHAGSIAFEGSYGQHVTGPVTIVVPSFQTIDNFQMSQ